MIALLAFIAIISLQNSCIDSFLFHFSKREQIMSLYSSKVIRNENFAKLQAGYLFPEIARRRKAYTDNNPDAKIISLGIGDTTLPIPQHILKGLVQGASKLGTAAGYSGYGAEQGFKELREKIASKLYNNLIEPEEVFVSDGAKCDISRLQLMFGAKVVRFSISKPPFFSCMKNVLKYYFSVVLFRTRAIQFMWTLLL